MITLFLVFFYFFLLRLLRSTPTSTLFPYTTLFRSNASFNQKHQHVVDKVCCFTNDRGILFILGCNNCFYRLLAQLLRNFINPFFKKSCGVRAFRQLFFPVDQQSFQILMKFNLFFYKYLIWLRSFISTTHSYIT